MLLEGAALTRAALFQVPVDTADVQSIRQAFDKGAYVEAERLAAELYDGRVARSGQASPELFEALDLYVDALERNGKGGAASTRALAERAVRLKEAYFGRDHPEIVPSLLGLGDTYVERGEFRDALQLYARSLDLRLHYGAAESPPIADCLDRVASALIRLSRLAEARERLKQSLRIRRAHPELPLALAHTLTLVGLLHRYDGDYAAAAPQLAEALEIRRRLSPNDVDLVAVLQLRGELSFLQGDMLNSRAQLQETLSLAQRVLRPEHPAIAQALRYLALVATASGDLDTSRELLERARQLSTSSLPPCHPETVWLLNDLGQSRVAFGRYSDAEKLYGQEVATIERCQGASHVSMATAVHNQADLATELGQFTQAEKLYGRAIQIWSTTLGPSHAYVGRGLDALAAVLARSGQLDKARLLYERALAIRQQSLGPDHPDVAWTLTNIARIAAASGQLAVALRLIDQTIDIYRRGGVPQEPDHFARVLLLRAEVQVRQGNFGGAQVSFREALKTREQVFGETHPLTAEARADLALAHMALDSDVDALREALTAEQNGRDHLRFTIRYLPERQAMEYAAKRPKGLDLALSVVAAGSAADPSIAFESVIQSRGVILDELAARARSTTAVDPDLAVLNATLVSARQRFANLMLRSLQGEDPVPRRLLDDARQQKEDAERALAEVSAVARADLASARAGLDDVRGTLPQSSALVSFVRYGRTVISKVGERTAIRTVPSYIAFVIRSDSPAVVAIPLGAATTIDAAVHAWREQAAGQTFADNGDAGAAEAAYRAAGTALRRRVWDPVAAHLGGATQVLITPDGALNLVGFATLPTGARGYLAEQPRTIHYVSTERDLIPIERAASTPGLLAVGGASFDLGSAQPQSRPRTAAGILRSGCGSLKSAHFDDLPGSREEVADIARVWRRAGFDQPMILTGRGATETAVKKAVGDRQVVHLATHGFFLGSDCDGAPAGTRAVGGLKSSRSGAPEQTENPLLLSGLALSGANNHIAATSPADDGILTAEEVASLNLQKTDWVVLSACDTGIGEVRPGEGVFGLRRAFQIAGARTVIMSLWSIDDQAAREWMRALYQDHFERHLSTAEAMREASLSVLRARRARGQSTHPFYWGAFVAAGDWR